MPPKKPPTKADGKSGGAGLGETDFSDAQVLPQLNDFVFMTMYAFKYRKNQQEMEQALMGEFDMSALGNDPETAEQAKRNRVIQMSDLLERAKTAGYLSAAEAEDIDSIDTSKLTQILARCTNELLVSMQLPLRRQKAEMVAEYEGTLEKAESPSEKESIRQSHKQKQGDAELVVWLKDYPRSAEDVQAMRRNNMQHMPELEIAIHAAVMIEEQFSTDPDGEEEQEEEESVLSPEPTDQSVDQQARTSVTKVVGGNGNSPTITGSKIRIKAHLRQYKRAQRIQAFTDLADINKFAHGANCPATSQMRLFVPKRMKFVGPAPPPEEDDRAASEVPAEHEKKKGPKKDESLAPVEVPRTEEQKAADKLFAKFIKQMRREVDKMAEDLSEYRILTASSGPDALKRVALWPRLLTAEEKMRIKKEEEARLAAEAEALQASLEESKGKLTKDKGKKPGAKEVEKPPSRGESRTQKESRPSTSSSAGAIRRRLAEWELQSQDDEPRSWNMGHFERVTGEMKTGSTSVGTILAAMVYQIEKQNESFHQTLESPLQQTAQQPTSGTAGQTQVGSTAPHGDELEMRSEVLDEIEQIFLRTAMESAVVETDFKHQFDDKSKIGTKSLFNQYSSPYQEVLCEDDTIHIRSESYRFLNGCSQGQYENSLMNELQLPGINKRFGMPEERAARDLAERRADTGIILRNCGQIPTNQAERMIVLKEFQDMLKANNPERTYDFMDRNYQEFYDAATFRQVLADASRMGPDVNTAYFDKEDALLLALNFKNPQGRLLRRQWTAELKSVPSFQDWSQLKNEVSIPRVVLNIPFTQLGLVRQNTKFCFPYDNAVIRVQKNIVGSRRFGSTLVIKDNLTFGIKESKDVVSEKVPCQDEILSMEARKTVDNRCEFWIEFENGTRMHAEMQNSVRSRSELIPPQSDEGQLKNSASNRHVLVDHQNEDESAMAATYEASDVKSHHSNMGKSSLRISAVSKKVVETTQDKKVEFQENASGVVGEQGSFMFGAEAGQPTRGESTTQGEGLDSGRENGSSEEQGVSRGASLTFTYKEGLVVQILPDGSVKQTIVGSKKTAKKQSTLSTDALGDAEGAEEVSRTITRSKVVIREMADGNQILYFPDGAITYTDHRRGIWRTISAAGVVRERNLRTQTVSDSVIRLECNRKVDPETQAVVNIREDGFLKIDYEDRSYLCIMPDNTKIHVSKSAQGDREQDGSRKVTTLITKQGYSPFRLTFNPVKAQSATVIGLGGADAMMGRDGIMERSNGGLIAELFLPDRTVVESWFETQELPGVNQFSSSMIHLVRRSDYSCIKVRQDDGEIVVISANARSYLNQIGKQEEFGTGDYDYFFELFGTANERRSGIYTINMDQGRLWTRDEEGNHFIAYANGDTIEKLSVSFNLDQMIEGIENKEPTSPRGLPSNGEFIDNECKFLPPPKTVGHPRLFLVRKDGALEYSNYAQLEYMIRCQEMDKNVRKSHSQIVNDNEQATSHVWMREDRTVEPSEPETLADASQPLIPQALETVNQTVSIRSEPENVRYLKKQIIEFRPNSEDDVQSFYHALSMRESLRKQQTEESAKMTVKTRTPEDEALVAQTKLMLRIAKTRGIDVKSLIDEEYTPVKVLDADQKRANVLADLDNCFTSERQGESTQEDSA